VPPWSWRHRSCHHHHTGGLNILVSRNHGS
jgi:hypothetical protein